MKWRCLMSRRAFLVVGFQDSKKKRYKNREKKREKNKIKPNMYSIKCFDKGISDLKTHLDYSYHHARSLWNFEFSRWKKIRPNMYSIKCFDKGISDLKKSLDYLYPHARSLWNFEFSGWKKIRPNMYSIKYFDKRHLWFKNTAGLFISPCKKFVKIWIFTPIFQMK